MAEIFRPNANQRIARAVRGYEHRVLDKGGQTRKYRGATSGGASEEITGRITVVRDGTGTQRLYDAESLDGSISITAQRPRGHAYDSTFVVHTARVDNPNGTRSLCTIRPVTLSGQVQYFLWHVDDEYLVSTSCTQQGTAGSTATSMAAQEWGARRDVHHTDIALLSSATTVSSGTTDNIGIGAYTFPVGFTRIIGVVLKDVTISAPSNTNALTVGVGTASAAGSTGALSGTDNDIVTGITSAALTSTGIEVDSALADVDVDTTYDGSSTAVALYLNMSPNTNWTANEDITVSSGTLRVTWINLGGI